MGHEASVLVSTYDRPDALRLVLAGFERQTALGRFEVIVADDGSGDETRRLVSEAANRVPYPLRHVWQEDRGFRKARILNQSIATCDSSYLIFNDGDCIPHRAFVEEHLRARSPGVFLVGRSVFMSAAISSTVDEELVRRAGLEGLNFRLLWDSLFGETKYWEYSIHLRSSALLRFVRRFRRSRALFGCNFSCWKHDLIAVNGFNEDFEGWGSEDGELGLRMLNGGVRPELIINQAISFHYHHERSHAVRKSENVNRSTRTRRTGTTWCERGLDQYLKN